MIYLYIYQLQIVNLSSHGKMNIKNNFFKKSDLNESLSNNIKLD